ncbi:hypothetical protein EDD11_007141 [Mortierella claussenii]|nr:hypothetical protein EDD11_007141 [Mortierella claussenii]
MLDTGSSLSWIQTADCSNIPSNCNSAIKFNTSLSSTIVRQPELISVKYTEGIINTQLVSDVFTLGSSAAVESSMSWSQRIPSNKDSGAVLARRKRSTNNNSNNKNSSRSKSSSQRQHSNEKSKRTLTEMTPTTVAQALEPPFSLSLNAGTFGLTSNIAGDAFLLGKEELVSGFLGASQRRFESDSEYSTHVFAEIIRKLLVPVFGLAFQETWGTLTLGGPDPSFHSESFIWIKTLPDEAGWVTGLGSHIELLPQNFSLDAGMEPDYALTNLDRVWFDSGTTYIWGDANAVRPLNEWMGADPATGQVDCASIAGLGKIVFWIGGTSGGGAIGHDRRADEERGIFRLELNPSDYIISTSTSRKCFSALNASVTNKNHWIFGLHLLRRFYTVYHYGYGLIGIAPYNITAVNPVGQLVLPGSHDSLEHEVQKALRWIATNNSARLYNKSLSSTVYALVLAFILVSLIAV